MAKLIDRGLWKGLANDQAQGDKEQGAIFEQVFDALNQGGDENFGGGTSVVRQNVTADHQINIEFENDNEETPSFLAERRNKEPRPEGLGESMINPSENELIEQVSNLQSENRRLENELAIRLNSRMGNKARIDDKLSNIEVNQNEISAETNEAFNVLGSRLTDIERNMGRFTRIDELEDKIEADGMRIMELEGVLAITERRNEELESAFIKLGQMNSFLDTEELLLKLVNGEKADISKSVTEIKRIAKAVEDTVKSLRVDENPSVDVEKA